MIDLPQQTPEVLKAHSISTVDYELVFRSAVESIRGTFAASTSDKRRFIEAVLEHMKQSGKILSWEATGGKKRQDYSVTMLGEYKIAIEAKGGGDGNNTNIWDRPPWADEFVVWSQSPDSLQNDPGHGVWSALSTRILPKSVAESTVVDAFIFFDGRCGSDHRICIKKYGVKGNLRGLATDIQGQDGSDWLPPPCIYLLPRTAPHPTSNPDPKAHTSTKFTTALLEAFGVPKAKHPDFLYWATVHLKQDEKDVYLQVEVGHGKNPAPMVQGGWKKKKRD